MPFTDPASGFTTTVEVEGGATTEATILGLQPTTEYNVVVVAVARVSGVEVAARSAPSDVEQVLTSECSNKVKMQYVHFR